MAKGAEAKAQGHSGKGKRAREQTQGHTRKDIGVRAQRQENRVEGMGIGAKCYRRMAATERRGYIGKDTWARARGQWPMSNKTGVQRLRHRVKGIVISARGQGHRRKCAGVVVQR